MVSFWPWKGDDVSPASFEKALSTLSAKIANTQATLERTRSTSRRVRVLSTLYLSFAYLVYGIVLVLVVGYEKITAYEWAGLAGGPIVIFGLRTLLGAYFNFRIDSLTTKLKDQQHERAKTIQKLKDATRYDSTLQLLEKYGGEGRPAGKSGKGSGKEAGPQGKKHGRGGANGPLSPNRTNMLPPATANIRQSPDPAAIAAGVPLPGEHAGPEGAPARGDPGLAVSAEFAPNAYESEIAAAPAHGPVPGGQYAPPGAYSGVGGLGESHWYDRILDLLMGEDETAARNRIVLICSACRLVNGQAPPGTTSLADVGSWRCMGCGAMNGEAAEAKKIVSEVLGRSAGSAGVRPSSRATESSFRTEDDADSSALDEPVEAVSIDEKASKATAGGVRKREKHQREEDS